MSFWSTGVDRSTADEDIVDNSEDTFASDPIAVLVSDATIIQRCCLVESDAPTVNVLGKRNLVWMKVLPA